MPLYSLIALTLSLFGATYTAISALRNHFDRDIIQTVDSIKTHIGSIKGAGSPPETLQNAEGTRAKIMWWNSVWKWSLVFHIGAFGLFIFVIAFLCLFEWDDLPIKVAKSGQDMTQEAIQYSVTGFWIVSSICGRLTIAGAMVVNLLCGLFAYVSAGKIKSYGKVLYGLAKCAEETSAASRLSPPGSGN